MGIIVNDEDTCQCGAYWQFNGFCCNGHARIHARVTIDIDCGNTVIQKDEELFLEQEIRKLIEARAMKVMEIYFDR